MKNLWLLFLPAILSAEIIPLTPANQSAVVLLPENQRKLLSLSSHAERCRVLEADRDKGRETGMFAPQLLWREAAPVKFCWKCTAKESAPYLILLSETPDFKNAKILFSQKHQELVPPNHLLNLKIGQIYYWKVVSRKEKTSSAVFSFITDPQPPRWIAVEGRTKNMRDLGGYKTEGGGRVRQGILFRGQGLNDNSYDFVRPGRSRLMAEDIRMLTDEFAIRTDLDLRTPAETAGMKGSPLGDKVKWVLCTSSSYERIFSPVGKKMLIKAFRVLCNPANHPLYFHCIGGADRTGALAMVANGVLGVSENDLCADWGNTFFPQIPDIWRDQAHKARFDFVRMLKGFEQYGKSGDSLQKRIENYLLSGGITPEEIEFFRKTMIDFPQSENK